MKNNIYLGGLKVQTIKTKTLKKTILVLGTGGTIAGTGEEAKTVSYSSGQIKVDKLISDIPELANIANIRSENLFQIDSCDMSFEKLIKLANYINKNANNDDIDGFVITHGTDTLEETAYFLNLTVKTNKPVVLTGSMRPNTAISADGPFNLYQAVMLAQSQEAMGKGVLVVFSDTIYSARDITKNDTFRTSAFFQRDAGCLGYIRDDEIFIYNLPIKKHTVESEFAIENLSNLPRVDILNFHLGAQSDILDYCAQKSDGIIIACAGCACCSNDWNKKIESILKSGKPVIRSSRIVGGLVTYPKSEIFTQGAYSLNLSPQKSRILLSLALTKTNDISKIQNIFEIY